MTPRKSESSRLVLKLTHKNADALAASLTTEAEFSDIEGTIEVTERAASMVDLRARWNTLMRGLIASEQVLGITEGSE
ncbi:MAG: hypothetical protein CND01_00840 [Marine Group II euryarchaeote MED-G34]|nr:MAG: hypothetical protein CND01_00840 [Marine Group II euryarchaeote MED-G34]|tara:strand:+ start:1126 stop:1359 length:234 start_codon:yes stop_codon:yes gene_type:complete